MRRARKSDMTLKIVDFNLGKNATATDELRYQATNDQIDIALVQEAYVSNRFLAGAGLWGTHLQPMVLEKSPRYRG